LSGIAMLETGSPPGTLCVAEIAGAIDPAQSKTLTTNFCMAALRLSCF